MSYTPSSLILWFFLWQPKKHDNSHFTDKLIKRCTQMLLYLHACMAFPGGKATVLRSLWFGFQGNAEPSCPAHGLLIRPQLWWMTVTVLKQAVQSLRSEGATHIRASHGKELCSHAWTLQAQGKNTQHAGRGSDRQLIPQYLSVPCTVVAAQWFLLAWNTD